MDPYVTCYITAHCLCCVHSGREKNKQNLINGKKSTMIVGVRLPSRGGTPSLERWSRPLPTAGNVDLPDLLPKNYFFLQGGSLPFVRSPSVIVSLLRHSFVESFFFKDKKCNPPKDEMQVNYGYRDGTGSHKILRSHAWRLIGSRRGHVTGRNNRCL